MMRSGLCAIHSVLAILLALGIGAAANAQTQPSSAAQTAAPTAAATPSAVVLPNAAVLHTNANLVLVDVVVADKSKPIHALDRGRFHIFEDGHEQTISSFDEHMGAAQAVEPNVVKLPPNTFSNTPVYPDTGVVNVLLLDALNTPIASQVDVRRQMIEYLGKIKPGTSLAIYTLASRLRLVQGFTTDAAQLAKVVQGTKAGPQQSVALETENGAQSSDELLDMMAAAKASAASIASVQQFMADTAAFQTDMRVRMTLDALNELARSLSGIPGRKNLIWFSGSFPIALNPDDALKSPFNVLRDYSDDVQQTAELLSAARVAVYPVDARGVRSMPTFQASYQATGNMAKGGNFTRDNDRFMAAKESENSTMQQIAEQTGGQEYVNTNDLADALAHAVEHGSDYYTVGYVPAADKLDGRFHKLQVKVDGVSYKLAYRRGYYADKGDKASSHDEGKSSHDPGKPSMIVQAAMFGAPAATQILFQARVMTADDPQIKGVKLPDGPAGAMAGSLKGPVTRYAVVMQIDPKGVRFVDTQDGTHMAALEVALIAYDDDGKRVNYFDRSVTLNLKDAQYARVMAGTIPAIVPLDLAAGKVALRMVILDRAAGRAGSLEVPVRIAAVKAGS